MPKPNKHEALIDEPEVAINYWRDRAIRQGAGYVSRGGKNSDHQVEVIKPALAKILTDLRFNSGLDYGCGWGRFSVFMARYCRHVVGVDIVNRFRKVKPDNVSFFQLDYPVKIPVADGSIDLFFAIMVLQHITGDKWFADVTKEIRRTLAPNAFVVIIDDITATAAHVRPRPEKVLVDAFELDTHVCEDMSIDSDSSHRLIWGRHGI